MGDDLATFAENYKVPTTARFAKKPFMAGG